MRSPGSGSLAVFASRTVFATLAAVTMFASGCSLFMHSMERPTAKVRDASISAVGLGGVSGKLDVDVTNPNDFGVPLSGIDWQLSIGGARAVTGAIELSRTIPARGVAPVETQLAVTARDAIAVGEALARGDRSYQLDATLHFSTAVGQLDVAISHAGTIDGGGVGAILDQL
jgi:LEA14-like dessication related protein